MHQGILICYWRYTIGAKAMLWGYTIIGAKARVMLKDVEDKKAFSPATGSSCGCYIKWTGN
jgi:hypothetical protein